MCNNGMTGISGVVSSPENFFILSSMVHTVLELQNAMTDNLSGFFRVDSLNLSPFTVGFHISTNRTDITLPFSITSIKSIMVTKAK